MDGSRFDHLTRMLGRGASRRSVLRGLLGIGGVAVAAPGVDARNARTRPTIPPPPPATTPAPTTTTAPPCPGQEQCPNSTLCCDAGSCARSGNRAICCSGTVCGLDCCDSPFQCCDRECCPVDTVCLSQRYPLSDEERCCGADAVCAGEGAFADLAVCCGGDTPDCCVRENGAPVCHTAAAQCCQDRECPGECAYCQDNGSCGVIEHCEPTTTTAAPVHCQDNAECTGMFMVCCDGTCMENWRCNCQACIAAGDCSNTAGCCDVVEDCGEPGSCGVRSCREHICSWVSDCRYPLGNERCCPVGTFCNEGGSCEQDMTCDPPCSGEFMVCCDGTCMENWRCNCQACIAAGDCSNTAGCCDVVEDCGEPGSCGVRSCREHICSWVSDCRYPLGNEQCCGDGLICDQGTCQQAVTGAAETVEPVCGVCDAYPNSYCDEATASCSCAPVETCADGICGSIDDGCGKLLECPPCMPMTVPSTTPAPQVCLAEGERCADDGDCCAGGCRGRKCRQRGRRVCQAACAT